MQEKQLVSTIAERVLAKLNEADPARVVVGISNRHVHLTDHDFRVLFGYGTPTVRRDVRQRGEFAAEEVVTLHGPRGAIERVRVMGPNRPATQVEVSRSDCRILGVDAPLALSGQLDDAAPIEISGPKGRISCEHAAIVAARHIHMGPDDAKALGLAHQDKVSVRFAGERGGVLDNFIIRIQPSYLLELHVDTDEGNAIDIQTGDYATILGA